MKPQFEGLILLFCCIVATVFFLASLGGLFFEFIDPTESPKIRIKTRYLICMMIAGSIITATLWKMSCIL